MQELLGPSCPARDEQGSVPAGHSEGVDDPRVHPGHESGADLHRGHRHPGGEVQEELAGLADKAHTPHELGVVEVVVEEGQDEALRAPAGGELDPGAGLPGAWNPDELTPAPGDRDEVALLERQNGLLAELPPPHRLEVGGRRCLGDVLGAEERYPPRRP
jgi:hypothetical protein